MNIQQIRYIIAVAEYKHFGMAAEKCFITQSTLSTMIAKFEKEVEIRIFDRKTKPVTTTQEGEVIIQKLRNILREVDYLNESIRELKGEVSGNIRIGIIPTVAPFLLPRFLSSFARRHPGIQFSVSELTTDVILEKLKSRELDLGIAALPLEDDDIQEFPLYNEEFVLYDCYKKDIKERVKIEEINKNKLCLLADGHCLNHQIVNICDLDIRKYNAGINFDFKAGSIDSLIRFVRQSHGVTLLPYLAILDFEEKDRTKISMFQDRVPVRNIGIVTHKHFVKKQVLELLQKEIQRKINPLLKKNKHQILMAPTR